jgi:adenine-specific DNA-methyltransferase
MPKKKAPARKSVPKPPKKKKPVKTAPEARPYVHSDAQHPIPPDVGTQPLFKQKKAPATFRHTPSIGLKPRGDTSAPPNLEWDGQNPARETGEALIREILEADDLAQAKAAASKLKAMSQPFLNWVGKAERLSFDVPTLPLFVHERLSTKAIIETLKSHRKDKGVEVLDLFGDPQRPIADQVLRAYEHGPWTNRMILGDSLVVMNSLLQYEGLGGKVQMIYMDPPYGVKFGSNFQPFVRKRDVSHGDDEDMTREPEMVKAYRDTWERGTHSYLSYLRDRLIVSNRLLHRSGSVFVQISDDNLHLVRGVLDEVFGAQNFVSVIIFRKKSMPLGSSTVESMSDFILWYARDRECLKVHQLYRRLEVDDDSHWSWLELPDGSRRKLTRDERNSPHRLPVGGKRFQLISLYPPTYAESAVFDVEVDGEIFRPRPGACWITGPAGFERLKAQRRLMKEGHVLRYVLYEDDFPYTKLTSLWNDTQGARDKLYVVETDEKTIQRCMLMSTDPGDLVLDPTCGGGTTALTFPP